MSDISKLKPEKVFTFFEFLSSVPHGSGNTKAVSDLCVKFAKERGLDVVQDKLNNIVIRKPATAGYEQSPTVILQGHLDMVCAKHPEDAIDMEKEPIKLRTDGKFLWAERTSLGGDDMIAVASALAVLDDDALPHPALECLFTVDEETGMFGAEGIDPALITGRRMLNMDSEDEGVFTVGCAGGTHVRAALPVRRESLPADSAVYKLTVDGLRGGHSGVEIDCGRGNSNLLSARILLALADACGVRVAELNGGTFDNVIPSKTEAIFAVEKEKAALAEKTMRKAAEEIRAELAASDPDVRVTLEPAACEKAYIIPEDSRKLLSLLFVLPNGVMAMSQSLPGLVQTSLSQGVLRLEENALRFGTFIRSSVNSERETLAARVTELLNLYGAKVAREGDYPAWEYRAESPLRDVAVQTYRELTGKEAKIFATHGGLECGLFSEKFPGLDCIAFGPNMHDIHSVNEKLDVASVGRFYELVCAILKNLK